jgi:hypothetical protein
MDEDDLLPKNLAFIITRLKKKPIKLQNLSGYYGISQE